jgi:hypothetical protein
MSESTLCVRAADTVCKRWCRLVAHAFHAWTEMAAYNQGAEHLGM